MTSEGLIEFLQAVAPEWATKLTMERMTFVRLVSEASRENAELRGLIAECLALNPVVTGDMEKVRVWADVVSRMRAAARPAQQTEEQP